MITPQMTSVLETCCPEQREYFRFDEGIPDLSATIERLKAFRASHRVDEAPRMTTDEFDVITSGLASDAVLEKPGNFA